jgi:transcriptional regulator NrdR family protein
MNDARKPRAPEKSDDRGIECPQCGCRHFLVIDTRPMWGGRVRRRRECRHCGRRVTTVERVVGSEK